MCHRINNTSTEKEYAVRFHLPFCRQSRFIYQPYRIDRTQPRGEHYNDGQPYLSHQPYRVDWSLLPAASRQSVIDRYDYPQKHLLDRKKPLLKPLSP